MRPPLPAYETERSRNLASFGGAVTLYGNWPSFFRHERFTLVLKGASDLRW